MSEAPRRRVVLASGNAHKVQELRQMLTASGAALEVVGMKELGDPPEVEETETTFSGNAALKSTGIAAWLQSRGEAGDTLVLSDDSGICIDAFDGAPGGTLPCRPGGLQDPDGMGRPAGV